MHKLEINVDQFGDANPEQIRDCLNRGLPEFIPAPIKHDGTLILVGSGMSMPDFINEIRQEKFAGKSVWAMNMAHDYLMEHSITPDIMCICDPRPMPQNLRHLNDDTVYLVASRCHPSVFDALEGKNVLVWHSWSKDDENDAYLKAPGGDKRVAIGGGTTVGLRAINLGYVMGFRKFILYGYDSCNTGTMKAIGGRQTGKSIDVHVGGREFNCNYAMAQQADDFQHIYDVMPDITVECRGDGLISAIIEERKKQGFRT